MGGPGGGGGDAARSNKAEQGQTAGQYTKVSFADPRAYKQEGSAPDLTGGVKQAVAGGQADLKDKAAAYTAAIPKAKTVSDADVDRAVGGDTGAEEAVRSSLYQTYAPPPEFDYGPPTAAQSQVDALKKDGGVEQRLKETGGAGYTSGMSRFDKALMGGNAGVQQHIGEAEQSVRDFGAQIADTRARTKAQVDLQKNNVDLVRQLLKQKIQGRSDALKGTLEARRAERQKEADAAATKVNRDVYQAMRDRVNGALAGLDGVYTTDAGRKAARDALTGLEGGLMGFVRSNAKAGQLGLGDVANTDEAAQYRRVMGLLGLGGDLEKTNTGMTAGGYDEAALQAAIDAAVASGQGAEADALRVVGGAPTGDAGTWSKDPLVGPLQDAFNDAGGAISGAFKDALAANNAALKDAVQANKTTGGGAPGGTVHGNAQNSVVQTIEDLVTNPADTLAAGLESTSNVIRDPVGAGKKTLNRWRGR